MLGDPPRPEDKQHPDYGAWGFAMSIGWELLVSVLGGFFVGQWLDKKLKTSPWLVIAGSLFGISVGLYRLIKIANERVKKRP